MHSRHRAAELETYADSFCGADDLPLVEDLLEGVAANELHPQADPITNLFGAVDSDDVRMPHPSEQSPFVDDCGGGAIAGEPSAGKSFSATSRSSRVSQAR